MDRRKKTVDAEKLRNFRSEFYAGIEKGNISLIDAVKGMRKMSNLTQKEFAEFSQISIKSIKELENGAGNPTLKTLNQIGAFFGLEIAYTKTRATRPKSQ